MSSTRHDALGREALSNLTLLFSLRDAPLKGYHQISDLVWHAQTGGLTCEATGNDPILRTPLLPFEEDKDYILEISATSPDPHWSLYYLKDPRGHHSEDNCLNFQIPASGSQTTKRVFLPGSLCNQELRIDPGSSAGPIRISHLAIYEFARSPRSIIRERCRGMDPVSWGELLWLGASHRRIGDMRFPGLPDEQLQKGMVGQCGKEALNEIRDFYATLMECCEAISWSLHGASQALDFGCGFGRVTRFFLKDVDRENLYATDAVKEFVNLCRELFPASCMIPNHFLHNAPMPPLSFSGGFFDLITAYSVFTHLSEEAAVAWMEEFHRILKPGGMVALTLRQRGYLNTCAELRGQSGLGAYGQYEAEIFGDRDGLLPRYNAGEFIFHASGGGEHLSSAFYGNTVIPPSWIKKHWGEKFILRAQDEDAVKLNQSFLLLQKI